MTTTTTIPARTAIVATVAAIWLAVAACGTEQGTAPDRGTRHATQHAPADDVAAQIEHRKASLTQTTGSPRHAVADDVERWIEQRKSAQGTS